VDTRQIFRLLELGKKPQLKLTYDEAKTLRSVLATMRSRTKRKFEALDVPFDSLTLSMQYNMETGIATFSLAQKPRKNYEVIAIVDSHTVEEPKEDV